MSFFSSIAPRVGQLLNENFNSIGAWQITGLNNYSFGSSGLLLSGSNNSYSTHISNPNYLINNIGELSLRCDFIVTSIAIDNGGFGIGFTSIHPSFNYGSLVEVSSSNGILTLALTSIGYNYAAGNSIPVKTVVSNSISCAVNDRVIVKADNKKNILKLTIINATTGATAEINNLRYLINTAKLSLYHLGGDYLVKNLSLSIDFIKHPTLLTIGDSITDGSAASTLSQCYTYVAAGNNTFIKAGGSADRSVEAVQNTILSYIEPKYVFIALGTNDVPSGVPQSTFLNNLSTIGSWFPKSRVVYGTIIPNSGFDPTSWNSALVNTFGSQNVFNSYALLLGSGHAMDPAHTPDGTHPDDPLHAIYGNGLKGFLNI